MDVQSDAMAGAVNHLRAAFWTLVPLGLRPVPAIHQDLANGVMDISAGDPRADRFDAGVERLKSGGVHASDLVWDLSHDHRAGEVSVVMACAGRREDVDDDRRSGSYRPLSTKVRHGAFGRACDDHLRAGESHFTKQQLGAGV